MAGEEARVAEARRITVFGLVGAMASLTHLAVAGALMEGLGLSIWWANLGGFAVAFGLSYLGHYHLTFTSGRAHGQAVPRFLATALIGLGVNNAALWVMVRLSGREALGFVLVAIGVAAAVTYVIARLWVFDPPDSSG